MTLQCIKKLYSGIIYSEKQRIIYEHIYRTLLTPLLKTPHLQTKKRTKYAHTNVHKTYKHKGQMSRLKYIKNRQWKMTYFMNVYYKHPQDVQMFSKNDWIN